MSDILAIDIGGTTVKLGLVHPGRPEPLDTLAIETLTHESPDNIARRIAQAGRELIRRSAAPVAGVGVGCPGLVDNVQGLVRMAVNLPLNDYPLGPVLSRELDRPVALQNDANAAVLGEYHFGENLGCANLVYLTIGTGIGGGVICDGKLLVGNNNGAAELGHIKVEYTRPAPCGCGKRGCMEAYCGIAGIHSIAREVAKEIPGSKINSELSTRQIAEAAAAEDPAALEVLRRVGLYLGRGIANLIDIFNPAKVVFGGGASRATPFFMPGIAQSLDELCTIDYNRRRCTVLASTLPDTAGLLGAAAVFLESRR